MLTSPCHLLFKIFWWVFITLKWKPDIFPSPPRPHLAMYTFLSPSFTIFQPHGLLLWMESLALNLYMLVFICYSDFSSNITLWKKISSRHCILCTFICLYTFFRYRPSYLFPCWLVYCLWFSSLEYQIHKSKEFGKLAQSNVLTALDTLDIQ